MPVKEWIGEFLKRYKVRLGPHDWPTEDAEFTEFLRGWVEVLDAVSATEAEAYAALVRLTAAEPPRFRSDHLPAVVAAIRAGRREQAERERVHVARPVDRTEGPERFGPMTDEQRARYDEWLRSDDVILRNLAHLAYGQPREPLPASERGRGPRRIFGGPEPVSRPRAGGLSKPAPNVHALPGEGPEHPGDAPPF